MKTTLIKYLLIPSIIFTVGCKRDKDDPEDPHDLNEEELITTVELHFTNSTGTHIMAKWSDIDGPGGTAPVIDSLFLDTNSVYDVSIEFLDESGEEAEDMTHEIEEEDDEHLICFDASSDNLTINRADSDGTFEVGLMSKWTTSEATIGTVTISLKHQPDVKDGTCVPGETDVEVTFPMVIE
jgi:hypothetical protein